MGTELEIRPYRPGDEQQVMELFQLSFGRQLDQARWRWRYLDNPAGRAIIDLAWHGESLVAHHAVSPVALHACGSDWRAGLGVAVMTHPKHRGRGIFSELLPRTYARMVNDGMPMVWVFANEFSHRLVVRDLGFMDIHEVPTLRLRLDQAEGPTSPPAGIIEVEGFDDRFDRLWDLVKGDSVVIARRDREHLSWRYPHNPTQQYRILACLEEEELRGYAVLKRYKGELQVIDLLTVQRPDVALALVSRAVHIARQASLSAVSLWLNVSHPLHWMLEKAGFRNGEPITYFAGRVLRAELPETVVCDYRNWYLTMGDSDVY
jgi:GNAT superfamily N-acetyltransferase